MREKVREYIDELDAEYDRCMEWIEENMNGEACQVSAMEMRAKTLMEVKNDLQGRLEENYELVEEIVFNVSLCADGSCC